MGCLEFRRVVLTHPASLETALSPALRQHLAQCGSCQRFAKGQGQLEAGIRQAIEVEIPAGLASRILLRQRMDVTRTQQCRRGYAMAAGFLLGALILSGIWWFEPVTEPLDKVVLRHIDEEQHHLSDRYDVSLATLNQVLQGQGFSASEKPVAEVNYANACRIRHHDGVHLVLASPRGPVTVLLMPGEHISHRQEIKGQKYQGVIVPTENGSLAIVGQDKSQLESIERRLQLTLRVIS